MTGGSLLAQGTEPERLRLALADDHTGLRARVRMLLEMVPGWEVVAESGDADAARRQVREHHPDVLILDLRMPGGSSLRILPRLRSESPDTRVVILTMEAEPAIARQALSSGAAGYVLKETAHRELVDAVRARSGRRVVPGPCVGRRRGHRPAVGAHDRIPPRGGLTAPHRRRQRHRRRGARGLPRRHLGKRKR